MSRLTGTLGGTNAPSGGSKLLDHALRQTPLYEQVSNFRNAQVPASLAALAHYLKQDRPLAIHQSPVNSTSAPRCPLEVGVHHPLEVVNVQPALGLTVGVLLVAGKGVEPVQLNAVDLCPSVQYSGARPSLVQGPPRSSLIRSPPKPLRVSWNGLNPLAMSAIARIAAPGRAGAPSPVLATPMMVFVTSPMGALSSGNRPRATSALRNGHGLFAETSLPVFEGFRIKPPLLPKSLLS